MQRTLWLRIHPGAYDMASSTLTRAAMRVLAVAKASGEPAAEIEIADLRGHTNTFEFIGPKSSQVIHGVMKLVSEDKRKEVKEVCATLPPPRNTEILTSCHSSGTGLKYYNPLALFLEE